MHLIVIHGPMATGKTFHAKAFQKHYCCIRIIDGWATNFTSASRMSPPRDGDLVLTTLPVETLRVRLPLAKLIDINTARAAIGLEPAPAGGFLDEWASINERTPIETPRFAEPLWMGVDLARPGADAAGFPPPFAEQLGKLGITLPLRASADDIGAVLDRQGKMIFAVDVDRERSDADTTAIAQHIAAAVNNRAGLATEAL